MDWWPVQCGLHQLNATKVKKSWRTICFHLQENYSFMFQQVNNTKHPVKTTQKLYEGNKVDVLEWKEIFTANPPAIWQSVNSFARRNGVKLQCPDV